MRRVGVGAGDEVLDVACALRGLFARWNELDDEGLGYPGAYLVMLGDKSP